MFRLVESPTIFPQRSLTGSTVGPMVDTQVIVPNGGRIYVTRLEAGEIGRHFGMLSTEAAKQKDARIKHLEGELAEALAQINRVRELTRDNIVGALAAA